MVKSCDLRCGVIGNMLIYSFIDLLITLGSMDNAMIPLLVSMNPTMHSAMDVKR